MAKARTPGKSPKAKIKSKTKSQTATTTIKVNYLARVEGEAALHVRLRQGRVEALELRIFEPPRFFEAFLRGRSALEAPDITARICGICPVAYQMTAVQAVEQAFGVQVTAPIAALRRLLYLGEWIESHALHVHMLHAPDFLGYPDGIAMAKEFPREVQRGLALKKTGNALVSLIGGREVHPINVKVGGFHRLPRRDELQALAPALDQSIEQAADLTRWTASLPFPDCERRPNLLGLKHATDYAIDDGHITLRHARGDMTLAVAEFDDYITEQQGPYSNALHAVFKDHGTYLTGPLARWSLNRAHLAPRAMALADSLGLETTITNPYRSIIIRSLEILHALLEARRLVADYDLSGPPAVAVQPRAGVGAAVTEAPRGLLFHRYRIGADGLIQDAKIVPPTSQNQKAIEDDLRQLLESHADLPRSELASRCEKAIRNHDPCISCATHFLRLDFDSEERSDGDGERRGP